MYLNQIHVILDVLLQEGELESDPPDTSFINPLYVHKTPPSYYTLPGTRYMAKNKTDHVHTLMEYETQLPHN